MLWLLALGLLGAVAAVLIIFAGWFGGIPIILAAAIVGVAALVIVRARSQPASHAPPEVANSPELLGPGGPDDPDR